jgi:hypothetical protein
MAAVLSRMDRSIFDVIVFDDDMLQVRGRRKRRESAGPHFFNPSPPAAHPPAHPPTYPPMHKIHSHAPLLVARRPPWRRGPSSTA